MSFLDELVALLVVAVFEVLTGWAERWRGRSRLRGMRKETKVRKQGGQ